MARPLKNPPAKGGGYLAGLKNKPNETSGANLVGGGTGGGMTRKGKTPKASPKKVKRGA